MAVHGRCLCEGVKFEIDAEPMMMGTCHCTRCQRRSGGPGITGIAYPPDSVTYTQGEDLVTVYEVEPGSQRRFCSRCGTPMPGAAEKFAIVQAGRFLLRLLFQVCMGPGDRQQTWILLDSRNLCF